MIRVTTWKRVADKCYVSDKGFVVLSLITLGWIWLVYPPRQLPLRMCEGDSATLADAMNAVEERYDTLARLTAGSA